jgi:hypothetical protein
LRLQVRDGGARWGYPGTRWGCPGTTRWGYPGWRLQLHADGGREQRAARDGAHGRHAPARGARRAVGAHARRARRVRQARRAKRKRRNMRSNGRAGGRAGGWRGRAAAGFNFYGSAFEMRCRRLAAAHRAGFRWVAACGRAARSRCVVLHRGALRPVVGKRASRRTRSGSSRRSASGCESRCVCVRACAHARVCVRVCVRARTCVCACVACVRACVRACVHVPAHACVCLVWAYARARSVRARVCADPSFVGDSAAGTPEYPGVPQGAARIRIYHVSTLSTPACFLRIPRVPQEYR